MIGHGQLYVNIIGDADNNEERREQRESVDRGCEEAELEVSDSLEVAKKLIMYYLMSYIEKTVSANKAFSYIPVVSSRMNCKQLISLECVAS